MKPTVPGAETNLSRQSISPGAHMRPASSGNDALQSEGARSTEGTTSSAYLNQCYWNDFYAHPHPDLEEPTSFARLCHAMLTMGTAVFEIGCGNGRDALYLARSGRQVTASDPSEVALGHIRSELRRRPPVVVPRLINKPMEDLDTRDAAGVEVVYMRFVLHAVTTKVGSAGLKWAAESLTQGGRILIEVRSVRGNLYGIGTPAGRDAFIHDGHYRRFIRAPELRDELIQLGFHIDSMIETDGVAALGRDDPVVIRAFATRTLATPT